MFLVLFNFSGQIDAVLIEPDELLLEFRTRRSSTDFLGKISEGQDSVFLSTTSRSTMFSNSRMLPGQSYSVNSWRASGETPETSVCLL